MSERPIIYDLCAGTGAWSQPYMDAGYDVRRVTLPDGDVRLLPAPDGPVRGVLAAPPCTYFSRMRMCRGRPTDAQFIDGLSVVDACLRFIHLAKPSWWALENPQGYLHRWLGEPALKFHPWQYGDPWTKRTWIWGEFARPAESPVEPTAPWISSRTGHPKRRKGIGHGSAALRAQTPPGFARAFFEANP